MMRTSAFIAVPLAREATAKGESKRIKGRKGDAVALNAWVRKHWPTVRCRWKEEKREDGMVVCTMWLERRK